MSVESYIYATTRSVDGKLKWGAIKNVASHFIVSIYLSINLETIKR